LGTPKQTSRDCDLNLDYIYRILDRLFSMINRCEIYFLRLWLLGVTRLPNLEIAVSGKTVSQDLALTWHDFSNCVGHESKEGYDYR